MWRFAWLGLIALLAAHGPTASAADRGAERSATTPGYIHALLTYEGRHLCRGLLLADGAVLTAAHCLDDKFAADVRVHLHLPDGRVAQRAVSRAAVSPRYVRRTSPRPGDPARPWPHEAPEPSALTSDIALLLLAEDGVVAAPVVELPPASWVGANGVCLLQHPSWQFTVIANLQVSATGLDVIAIEPRLRHLIAGRGGCDRLLGLRVDRRQVTDGPLSTVCGGDSGSPVFGTRGRKEHLIGLLVGGERARVFHGGWWCGDRVTVQMLGDELDWIVQQVGK